MSARDVAEYALTVRRPWTDYIIAPDVVGWRGRGAPPLVVPRLKPIENRSWPPPRAILGARIALHAGSGWDGALVGNAAAWRRELGVDLPGALARSASPEGIVCTAIVAGYLVPGGPHVAPSPELLCVVRALARHRSWQTSAYGWILHEVRPLIRPVPAKGRLSLWRLTDEQREAIRRAGG